MGLSLYLGRARLRVATLLLVAVAAATGCVKELDLPMPTQPTAFVDGAVIVDSAVQRLRFGYTVGLAEEILPLPDAEIEVVNLTTDERHAYTNVGGVNYVSVYTPRYGEAYQLVIRRSGIAEPYRSRPDSLSANSVVLTAEIVRQTRLDREGFAVNRQFLTAHTTVAHRSAASADGVIAIRQTFVWAYADDVCGFSDISRVCYFLNTNEDEPTSLIDLSAIGASGVTAVNIGAEFINYRMAEQAYFVLASRRYSAAAQPYLQTYQLAQAPSGTPFDERLLPAIGNVEGPAEAPGVLGFFGVAEATLTVLSVRETSPSILGYVPKLCSANPKPTGFDCCECLLSTRVLPGKPSYIP